MSTRLRQVRDNAVACYDAYNPLEIRPRKGLAASICSDLRDGDPVADSRVTYRGLERLNRPVEISTCAVLLLLESLQMIP